MKDAKASAALRAVNVLYENGYLDNHLKPIFTTELGIHIGADEDDSNIEMVINIYIFLDSRLN